jgi:four helix bundle protein
MKNFRNSKVWQKAHKLVIEIYECTEAMPSHEIYGLRSQVRRSAVSVPSNIAGGCGRNGDAELSRFLSIAMGSASELEYQILLANDLGYLPAEAHQSLEMQIDEVKRMLAGFIKRLQLTPEG